MRVGGGTVFLPGVGSVQGSSWNSTWLILVRLDKRASDVTCGLTVGLPFSVPDFRVSSGLGGSDREGDRQTSQLARLQLAISCIKRPVIGLTYGPNPSSKLHEMDPRLSRLEVLSGLAETNIAETLNLQTLNPEALNQNPGRSHKSTNFIVTTW